MVRTEEMPCRERISVAVITFNEERNIRDCLESVKWADEIVVIDSGSTDQTVEICREYTDRIYLNPWPGNIEQWRFAMTKVSHDWVLSLDADERVSTPLRDEIRALDLAASAVAAYLIPRRVFFMGRWMNHSSWYPGYVPRLYNRHRGEWGGLSPHGVFVADGRKAKLKGDILHILGRTFAEYAISTLKYHAVSARTYHQAGRRYRWHQITIRPLVTFLHKYFWRLGFLDGVPGLAYSVLSAFGVFAKYVSLREVERNTPLRP